MVHSSYGLIRETQDEDADTEELQEISVWNTSTNSNTNSKGSHKNNYKIKLIIRAKWYAWRFLQGTGTMPSLQKYVEDKPILLLLTAFLRSCGMFYGLSNPIMGLCGLAAALTDSPFNFLFLVWSVSWTMIWSFCLKIPRALVLNGLYPSQGILLGYSMYITYEPIDISNLPNIYCMMGNFLALIPLTLINITLFHCLSTVLMRRGIPPMMIATMITSTAWWLSTGISKHFVNRNLWPFLIKPHREPLLFDITLDEYITEVIFGVSMLQFSNTKLCCVPITLGLFITSPISCVTSWCGSFVGISSCVLLGLDFKFVRLGLFGLNSAICFSVIAGNFFVLSPHSFLLAIIGTFASAFFQMAWVAGSKVLGPPVYAFPSTFIILTLYIVSDSLHEIYRVPIKGLTVPEDHLRRFRLTRDTFKHIPWLKMTMLGHNLDSVTQKEIASVLQSALLEEMLLLGRVKEVSKFLRLSADRRGSLVDGMPLHLAVVSDQDDLVEALINSGEKLGSTTQYMKSPLVTALENKNYKIAGILKKNGGKLKLSELEVSQILSCFVATNQNENLEAWLKFGAEVNSRDEFGRTAQHVAMLNGNVGGYEMLLKYGSKDCPDKFGRYPKDYVETAIENDYSMLRWPDATPTPAPHNPVNFSCSEEALNMITTLITSTQGLGEERRVLKDILLAFLVKHDVKHLQMCLTAGLGLHCPLLPLSLLHLAARHGNVPVVKLLCSQGAEVNSISRTGHSPLDEALQHGSSATCKILLSFGAKLRYYSSKLGLLRLGVLYRKSYAKNNVRTLENLIECGTMDKIVMYDKIQPSELLLITQCNESKELIQEYFDHKAS